MFEIKVIADFSSAHRLRGYKGKCEGMHGHNWKVEVVLKSKTLDKLGMVKDFSEVKRVLNDILNELDHKCLNELDCFKKVNPTSENIAKYIYKGLKKAYKSLKFVSVWESDTSCASYET
ncbi:MAG: 6-carboxytetrahydropterin synthase QueD [Candidatus Gygaella obscura]|nr:6-carboxytetrahydropterin synthase QueD [Candidatus Gygaella obscura]